MPKRINQVEGFPFITELEKDLSTSPESIAEEEEIRRHEGRVESESDSEKWEATRRDNQHDGEIKYILELVNGDVCMTKDQFYFVYDQFTDCFRDEEDVDNDEKNDENIMRLSKDEKERQLIVLINSFRLDCANCLNGSCKMRDPEKPVPVAPKEDEEK